MFHDRNSKLEYIKKTKPDAKRGDLERHGFGGWDCCLTTMLWRYKWTQWIAWSGEDTVDYTGKELTVLPALCIFHMCIHGSQSKKLWSSFFFSKNVKTKNWPKKAMKCNKWAYFSKREPGASVVCVEFAHISLWVCLSICFTPTDWWPIQVYPASWPPATL